MRRQVRLSRKPAVWHYAWDAEDRLTDVTTPEGRRFRYLYDPLGRRIAKRLVGDDGVVLAESTFVWDGSLLAEERAVDPAFPRPIVLTWEYDGFEPVSQTEHIMADDMSQDEIDSRFFAIVTDLTGSPRELIAEDGTLAWHSRSSLWGDSVWAADSAAYTPLRFPGQYFDRETGLHYNVNRYYDPATARYTSPDPLGLSPAPNPDAYVPNPQVATDPLGLSPYPKKFDLSGATQVSGRFPKNANPGEVLYRAKEDGSVTAYAVYDSDGVIARRVDVDPNSAPHGGVPAPHVLEMRKHVNPKTGQVFYNWEKMPRPARPDELP
jgi:RHS repeat-associated protein